MLWDSGRFTLFQVNMLFRFGAQRETRRVLLAKEIPSHMAALICPCSRSLSLQYRFTTDTESVTYFHIVCASKAVGLIFGSCSVITSMRGYRKSTFEYFYEETIRAHRKHTR